MEVQHDWNLPLARSLSLLISIALKIDRPRRHKDV
jgi:hypothetical protein